MFEAKTSYEVEQVSHDSFARQSLVRQQCYPRGGECAWCGADDVPLYHYGTEQDSGRRSMNTRRRFCSTDCCASYNS